MTTWRVDWIANNGLATPMTLLCDSEEHALAEEAAMRRAGKRDVVAWLDSETAGPWVAGDVPEACEVAPGIDEGGGVDPNTTVVICAPQIGAQRIQGAA